MLTKIKSCYLAHPIKLRHDIRVLELKFEAAVDIELVNPFYDAVERTDIVRVDNGDVQPWSKTLDYEKIVEGDIKSIEDCDGLVAWVEKTITSVGTHMEIWHAFSLKKKIYVISPDWNTHPWLKYVTEKSGGKMFTTFEDFEKYMKEEYGSK